MAWPNIPLPQPTPRRYVLVRVTDTQGMAGLVAEYVEIGPRGKGVTWIEAWATAGRRRLQHGGVWVVAETPNSYEPPLARRPGKRREAA